MARNADGRLEAFDVQLAASGTVLVQHVWQLGPGGSWSSWARIGGVGNQSTQPTTMGNAARNKDGTLELLATQGGSGASSLYASQTTPGGSWTGFAGMNGATLTGDPAVLYDGAFLEAFAATTSDTMVAEARTNVDDQFINWTNSKMTVTLVKVFRHAEPASQYDTPQSGDRFYAVQFRLADTGTASYSDAPSNGAQVVDQAGQSYQASISDAAGCQSFGTPENIAPGSSGLGCIVFEIPAKVTITKVQFTLDSGMGPQTGQWDVRK